MANQEHWETVYKTKQPHEVSWTQTTPSTSLRLIDQLDLPRTASIIDIGGGDSTLVDNLLDLGYTDLTVLDISQTAIDRAKLRLGDRAEHVTWIACDVTEFNPARQYDVWHDRAAFHFLTTQEKIQQYVDIAGRATDRYAIISTFSLEGPAKCSGLEVQRYDASALQAAFSSRFEAMECHTEDHITPFGTTQNFLFCTFRKIV